MILYNTLHQFMSLYRKINQVTLFDYKTPKKEKEEALMIMSF